MENGLTKLIESRKFWFAVMDAVISLVTYFVGRYAGYASQDLATLIAALQPIALLVIADYAAEDVVRVVMTYRAMNVKSKK